MKKFIESKIKSNYTDLVKNFLNGEVNYIAVVNTDEQQLMYGVKYSFENVKKEKYYNLIGQWRVKKKEGKTNYF